MTEWQPIETAPDEKAVLLYCKYIDSNERPAGMNSKIVVGIKRGRVESSHWISDVVESDSGYYGDVYINPIMIYPTHWMPLPKPPK